jgi:hypothetical protein
MYPSLLPKLNEVHPSQQETNSPYEMVYLALLSTDTASELNILGHNRHTLAVDGTKIAILE